MNNLKGILCAALTATFLCGNVAEAQSPPLCRSLLAVQLTPDVPDPKDPGFLSSLLGNQVAYQLIFQGQTDSTNILLVLKGPGPSYRCRDVIQVMRKDGRVLSIQVRKK